MGSRVRNLQILKRLSRDFDLTIVTLVHHRRQLEEPGPVAGLGRWVPVLASHRRGAASLLYWHARARLSSLTEGLHRETFFQSLPALARAAREQIAQTAPDLVHAAYWYALRRLPSFPRPPLWVVDTHDVQFERHARLFGRRSARERSRELAELCRYDRIVAITERDRETLRRNLPAKAPPIEVIGMGLDLEHWNPGAVRPALSPGPRVVFYGNLSTPENQRGAMHLCRDLLPGLRGSVPELESVLLGADPPAELRRAAEDCGARVTGFVEDVRPWLLSGRVLALSIRAGSGQRGRVVEALSLGLPVVGYSAALEGLELGAGEGILSVENDGEFRRGLETLLLDPPRAAALGEAGRAAVRARYGLEATYDRFPALYARLLADRS